MAYKLRFVQSFDKRDSQSFLELEQAFIRLEQQEPELVPGSRWIPVAGREPTNTLIWEAEFATLESAMETLAALERNQEHDRLLDQQLVFMRDAHVELYRKLEAEGGIQHD